MNPFICPIYIVTTGTVGFATVQHVVKFDETSARVAEREWLNASKLHTCTVSRVSPT